MDIHKLDEIDGRNRHLCTFKYIQSCGFLEVTAVHYDKKTNKDRQRCGIHDIKKEHLRLTVQLNQQASSTMDCVIMFLKY